MFGILTKSKNQKPGHKTHRKDPAGCARAGNDQKSENSAWYFWMTSRALGLIAGGIAAGLAKQ